MYIGPMMELEPQDIVQWVRGGASQRAANTFTEFVPRGYWDFGASLWDIRLGRSYWDGVEQRWRLR